MSELAVATIGMGPMGKPALIVDGRVVQGQTSVEIVSDGGRYDVVVRFFGPAVHLDVPPCRGYRSAARTDDSLPLTNHKPAPSNEGADDGGEAGER